MEDIINDYWDNLKIGRKQSYKNLTIYPLLSSYTAGSDYMLLSEALSADMIEITELDESGSVPELKVVNSAPMMVLILDGEELVGAKQNRIEGRIDPANRSSLPHGSAHDSQEALISRHNQAGLS